MTGPVLSPVLQASNTPKWAPFFGKSPRHWMEGTGLTQAAPEGSSCPAFSAQRLLGVTGGAPASQEHRPCSFTRISWKGHQAPHSDNRQPPALEPGSPWRQLEKGSWGHPLCCFQGLRKYRPVFQLPPLARRPPVLSSGAALGPVLACDHLMDVPGSQGPDGSIPSCSPSPPPAARQLGPLGLWGRFHRKGPALCDCRVFSVKPPAPSANPCVLLSPEQNVNQRLKAKGIEYLSYP